MATLWRAYIPMVGPGAAPRRKWLRICVEFLAFAGVIGGVPVLMIAAETMTKGGNVSHQLEWTKWLVTTLLTAGILTLFESLRGFGGTELTITDEAITQRRGKDVRIVRRGEIRRVYEGRPARLSTLRGLLIDDGHGWAGKLFIPDFVEGFQQARAILFTWSPAEKEKAQTH